VIEPQLPLMPTTAKHMDLLFLCYIFNQIGENGISVSNWTPDSNVMNGYVYMFNPQGIVDKCADGNHAFAAFEAQ